MWPSPRTHTYHYADDGRFLPANQAARDECAALYAAECLGGVQGGAFSEPAVAALENAPSAGAHARMWR